MLAIKLQRRGKKHQPSYRLVVQEKHSKLNGDFIDDLGHYNPKIKETKINSARVNYWIGVGAKATPTVHNMLVKEGIVKAEKIAVHKHIVKKAEPKVAEAPKAETAPPVIEEAKTE